LQLARQGSRLAVVDNLVNGKRENIDEALNERVQLVVADIRDEARMASLMQGVDVVFHLACLGVRHSIHSPRENHEVNAAATLRLLVAARAAGVGRFVYVSSSEVYGTALRAPMNEEHPTFPMTVYGAAKLAGECYTRAFHRTYAFPTVVVRPFNTFGPRCHHEGDCGEVIPKFMLRAMAGRPLVVFGDGTQTRDFTFVSDIARGIIDAGLCDDAVGETINLGSGIEIAVKDLARDVLEVVGHNECLNPFESAGGCAPFPSRDPEGDQSGSLKGAEHPPPKTSELQHAAEITLAPPRPGDVLRLCADTAKASRLLGFKPRVSLREGLRILQEWYESQGDSAADLLNHETVRNWELCPAGAGDG